MESLFKRLFFYRSTEKRRAWEDWLTESFAAVLCRDPRLGAAYAGHLIGRDVACADIETQRVFGRARPDMWIDARDADGGRHIVMSEHKAGRQQAGSGQLRAYERRLRACRADTETRTLVQIVRTCAAPDFKVESGDVRFRSFKWFEIYRWLCHWAESARSGGEGVEFVRELLKFMKERGMTIEVDRDELEAYTVCKASGVEQRLEQLLEAAWEDCEMTAALGGTVGEWKRRNKKSIYRVSPRIVRHGAKVIYGFSYSREDPEWNARRLGLPSAYVGIWKSGPDGARKVSRPAGWTKRPKAWAKRYVWVCQISEPPRRGELSASYLEFFDGAFTGLKAVL